MTAETLMVMGAGGAVLACVNAALWVVFALQERRWQRISDVHRWCWRRAWLNLALALVFALAWYAGQEWR